MSAESSTTQPTDVSSRAPELPAFCRSRPLTAIFLVSVLGLFLELMLIRWVGTEVRIFAYLQNTVLVVCFLGLGLGCFSCRRAVRLAELLVPLAVLVLLLAIPLCRETLGRISSMLSVLGDFVIWGQTTSDPRAEAIFPVLAGLAMTAFLMILIAEMFVPIGRILGRLLDDHASPVKAYSVNVAGSLIGIWGFVALSAGYAPPVVWVAVFAAFCLPFIWRGPKCLRNCGLLAACVGLAWNAGQNSTALAVRWSPYQKLVLQQAPEEEVTVGEYLVEVNNTGYQAIIDLREEVVSADPVKYPPEMAGYSQYDLPALLHPDPRSALIVGSGAGNDVAGALRHGLERVVAVEIDPAIVSLGRQYHPEMPYQSRSVELVIDDARSFFSNCDRRFDVISFGLLDSHTMTAMTNARLDHYVYTRESITQAKSLLAAGGIVVLSFEAQKPYIADRIAGVLLDVFGEKPLFFRVPLSPYGGGGVMFAAGNISAAREQIGKHEGLASLIASWEQDFPVTMSYTTPLTTDDWPYLYLQERRIPVLHFLLAALMGVLLLRFHRRPDMPKLTSRWSRTNRHFFFMGAAFLLLEVQNISKASAALGNTWWVNAVIISGVLTMILLANAIAAGFPRLPLGLVYLALCGSCLGLYLVDLSQFAFLPFASKAIIVGGLTTLPMLFSGIVFIRSFAGTSSKNEALGANLIGALAGALLQSATFAIGIKALLLIVTALYLLALLCHPRPDYGRAAAPELAPA